MSSGMNVPLYRRQTQLTRDSGARNLTAMASGSDYAAPANAAFGLGGAVAGAGQFVGDIAVTEAKQENATLLASEENKFTDYILQMKQGVLTSPVGQSQKKRVPQTTSTGETIFTEIDLPAETQQQHYERLQRSFSAQLKKQAARIGDSDFQSAASQKILSSLPVLQATLRTRYLDRHRATMDEADVQLRRQVATEGGATREQTINAHLRKIEENGLAQGESQVNVGKRKRSFLSGIDADTVNQSIVGIEQMPPGEQEAQYNLLFKDLSDRDKFTNLEEDDRIRLQKFVANQAERANTAYTNELNTADARNETARKRTQLTNYEILQKQILDYRAYAIGDRTGPAVKNVTEADISSLRGVTKPMRDSLTKMMRGEDQIYNPDLYNGLVDQIDEAVTDNDLDAIRETIDDHSIDGELGGKATVDLRKRIDDLKLQTPDALERKEYRALLKQAIGANAVRYGSNTDKALREAEIVRYYNSQLDEGMLPGVAYINAVERGKARTIENVTAMVQSLPTPLYRAFKDTLGTRNVLSMPGDDMKKHKTPAEQKVANDLFIEDVRSKMKKYISDQINGLETKYDLDFDGSDGGSQMTQSELGAAQRRPDEDGKRLSQKDRMSVRRLFALERQAEQIVDSLKSVSEFGFARTQRRGGGAGNTTEEPNKGRGRN